MATSSVRAAARLPFLFAVALLIVSVAGCEDEVFVDTIALCRCAPDEICVDNTCVPVGADARILDAPGPDASACAPSDAVRIAELRPTGTARPDFVELAGPPGASLEGWFLRTFEADGTRRGLVQLTGALDAEGLWLAAFGSGLEAEPDVDYGALGAIGLAAPVGSVELLDCAGSVVDAVGYGAFSAEDVFRGEGAAAPAPGAEASLARCPGDDGAVIDTDDNAADFRVLTDATPGLPNPACTPCTADTLAGQVWLGEVLYDPAGADAEADAFVEVRGVPDTALAGITLERWDEAAGAFVSLGALEGSLSAAGFFLVAERDAVAGADQVLAGLDADNAAGGFRLLACAATPLDVLGWGALADATALGLAAGGASPDVPDGASLGRCPDDVSALDQAGAFVELAVPTPGALNACP